MSWQEAARKAQGAVHNAILPRWKLPQGCKEGLKDVRPVPRTCGLLSQEQIRITELSATELVKNLASGNLSSFEVTEAFCARAAIAHQLVNCLANFFPQEGLARAVELDEYLRKHGRPIGPLHGLPVALKDTFDLPGKPTTYGYAANAELIADRESAIVKILREAGAVFYVKTTMPQTGMALETVSPLFGRSLNPFNADFVAGGSSGGDAILVALHGAPIAPSTDIGGSIRAPAAYNGLYGIRPSADRIPKRAMRSVEAGQPNIRVSCGPVCHSLADVVMFTRILNAYPQARYDPTAVPIRWRELGTPKRKLFFGLMKTDGAVTPHPPILRAMDETAAQLRAQGHEIIPFDLPFDAWECSRTTFKLYYPSGVGETLSLLDKAGELLIPSIRKMFDIYDPQPMSAAEHLECVHSMYKYKERFCDAWDATAKATSSGRPIDGIICPPAASAGYQHDFLPWWGYTTLFNILDYPSTILPLKSFSIDAEADRRPSAITFNSNPFDQANAEMYDPVAFQNQPVCLQIVARPFEDEELLRVTEVVDHIVNGAARLEPSYVEARL